MDVYQAAIRFVTTAHGLMRGLPRGSSSVVDQLRRAASSIPLNIAEGSGEYAAKEKARFYRIAKRSATECAGALDVMVAEEALSPEQVRPGLELLDRIVAMLIRLIQRLEQEPR